MVLSIAHVTFVRARQHVHASVLRGRVVNGKPNAVTRERLGVNERAVLMRDDFTARVRLFEDVHGLYEQGVVQSELI